MGFFRRRSSRVPPGLPPQPGVTIQNANLAAAAKAILENGANVPPPQDWLNAILDVRLWSDSLTTNSAVDRQAGRWVQLG
jgi:hypothetical protein